MKKAIQLLIWVMAAGISLRAQAPPGTKEPPVVPTPTVAQESGRVQDTSGVQYPREIKLQPVDQNSRGIEPPDRRMADLWIVTIDKSGSMMFDSQRRYVSAMRFVIAENVVRRLEDRALPGWDSSRARFLFLNSGILKRQPDPKYLRYEQPLVNSFIHHVDSSLHTFETKTLLMEHIRQQMTRQDYSYDYSFVSQLRLFSLIKGLAFIHDQGLDGEFEHIYLLTITDDADQNDQWMQDYRTLKMNAPDKIREVNDSTTKYLFNPLNARSNIATTGAFTDAFLDESATPHISLQEYSSSQSHDIRLDSLSQLGLEPVGDHIIRLTQKQRLAGVDSILYCYIDSLHVNGNTYAVKKWFRDSLDIPVTLHNGLNYNDIALLGYFQASYADTILGRHHRREYFTMAGSFPSFFLGRTERYGSIMGIALLLLLLIHGLLIAPRRRLFTLYDGLGKRLDIRRGCRLYGYFQRWSKGENALVSYSRDDAGWHGLYKKHGAIHARGHAYGSTTHTIVISSRRPLTLDRQDFQIESFLPDTDLDAHHETREYNPLLRDIYSNSANSRFFRRMHAAGPTGRVFFGWLVSVSARLSPHYYYLVLLKDEDFKDTTLGFSSPSFPAGNFAIECCAGDKSATCVTTSEGLIVDVVNEFYATDESIADTLIIVHRQPDRVDWHVIRLEYKECLHKVFEIFHYYELPGAGVAANETLIAKNIRILRRMARQSVFHVRRCRIVVRDTRPTIGKPYVAVRNIHHLVLEKNVFWQFLYLAETKEPPGRKLRQLYSPFTDGLQQEKMIQAMAGSYHLFGAFAPCYIEKDHNRGLSKQIAEEIFLFAVKRSLRMNIDRNNMFYANHTIPLIDR